MLNPIKSPTDMLYEQAGIPHFAGGKKVDVVTQFASRIQDAIARYTRATGKPPSAEEVRQLEDHVRSLSQPSTKPQQTQARLAQQTPGMSHLVDSSGRAYRPVVDPVTGKLVTPERAMGYDPAKQFGSTPMNARAREKYFDPNVGQKGYVFAPDEFTQVANAGRVSTRTNKRSHVPSSEELIAKQQAAEEVGNLPVGSYQMEEGPRSMMDEIAGNAQALEALPIFETRMDAMRALRPRPGDPHDPELMRDVERVRQSFLDRNIQPDDEDIINGLYSLRNPGVRDPRSPKAPPVRHNYTGENPIGERPSIDPTTGKGSSEMQDWRDQMRLSGQSERATTRSPSDWQPETRRDYLLDTTPDTRQPFAQDWTLEETLDRRRKQVPNKAEGGMMRSPRDMQAELMVNGYGGGGKPAAKANLSEYLDSHRGMTGPATSLSKYLDRKSLRGDYYTPETYAHDIMKYDREYNTDPLPKPKSPSERISETGQRLLEKAGISSEEARRISQTMTTGGKDSYLPFDLGMGTIGGMASLPGFFGMAPVYAADTIHNVEQGDWGSVALDALMTNPVLRAIKNSPRLIAGGSAATVGTGVNADPAEGFRNPFEYRSVLERN